MYNIIISIIISFLTLKLNTPNHEKFKKLIRKYRIGYDQQPVQTIADKLTCRRAALKCCSKIEILWYSCAKHRERPANFLAGLILITGKLILTEIQLIG